MNCSSEIVNSIKDKMTESLEKLMIDIDLENLINYKIEYEKQKEDISRLKGEKQDLIDEMDNFKKVSIFKSMVSQISEKDTEIKTLKSIIRNKDNIIKTLQGEKKKNKKIFNKSVLSDENEQILSTEKETTNENSKEDTQQNDQTPPINEEETTTNENPEEDTQQNVQTPPINEEETTTNENPEEDTQQNDQTPPIYEEETTTNENPEEDTQQNELTPEINEEEIKPEEDSNLEIQQSEQPPNEDSHESVQVPPNKQLNQSKEKIVKKLKGIEYFIIENKIFEKKKDTVGKQVGVCIIEQKKKKYKFTNKK